jgi:hypothetical protein
MEHGPMYPEVHLPTRPSLSMGLIQTQPTNGVYVPIAVIMSRVIGPLLYLLQPVVPVMQVMIIVVMPFSYMLVIVVHILQVQTSMPQQVSLHLPEVVRPQDTKMFGSNLQCLMAWIRK